MVMGSNDLLDLMTSWQIMELVSLGTGYLVDLPISNRIANGKVGFFSIGHPRLTSILSRLFMVMTTMTIQSKSNLLYVLLFGADFDGDCVHIYYPQSLVQDQLNSYPTRKVLSGATQRQFTSCETDIFEIHSKEGLC